MISLHHEIIEKMQNDHESQMMEAQGDFQFDLITVIVHLRYLIGQF